MLRRTALTVLGACALAFAVATPAVAQSKPAAQAKPPATQGKPPAQGTPATQGKPAAPATPLAPGIYAHFVTTQGRFTVKLMPEKAKNTVANFVGLAQGTISPATGKPAKSKPFYNGLTFHRIIPGFMIQGGDPTGSGSGGPGYTIPDEIDKTRKFDKAGIVAMANTGSPHTGGSQFFITLAPYAGTTYTIFGEVVQGLDVVMAIGRVPTDSRDKPLRPVVMKTVTIERVK